MRAALILALFLAGVAVGVLAYRWQDAPRTPVPAIELQRSTGRTATQPPPRGGGGQTATDGAQPQNLEPVPAGGRTAPPSADRDDDGEEEGDDGDDLDDDADRDD